MLRKGLITLTPVLAASLVSWILSTYIHYPTVEGSIYSDVVSFWHRDGGIVSGLIPCIDFFFEYPPASCFITYVARLLGGPSLEGYYTAFAVLSLPAFLLLGYTMAKLAGWPATVLALSPSLIVYGVYNYDHFMSALIGLGLLLYLSGRRSAAYVVLGVAASVKLFTVILLPILLSDRFRWRYVAMFIAGATPAILPVLAFRPVYFTEFIDYHASWSLENSWTIWLVDDPFSPSAKVVGWLTAFILFVRALVSDLPVERKCLLGLSGFLLGSPTFTPQMVVMLLPLLSTVPAVWALLPLVEASNVGIILTWFWVENPTHAWTAPQAMALVRALCLAAVWVSVYRGYDLSRPLLKPLLRLGGQGRTRNPIP